MAGNAKRGAILAAALAVVVFSGCSALKPKECRNSKYVEALQEQAVLFYKNQQYIEALKMLKDAEKCKPKDPEFYYLIGMIYMQRERPHEAVEYFEKSLAVDKRYTDARMALGLVYLSLHRWDEAIAQFEAAAADEFFPRPWEAYNNLAWAYLQKGDLDLAEVNANTAITQNNQWCPAYCNLGEIYARKDNKQKAMLMYQKSIKLCPENYARPHFLLGLEYGEKNHLDRACEEFAKARAVKDAPEAEQAYEYMGLYNCQGMVHRPSGQ